MVRTKSIDSTGFFLLLISFLASFVFIQCRYQAKSSERLAIQTGKKLIQSEQYQLAIDHLSVSVNTIKQPDVLLQAHLMLAQAYEYLVQPNDSIHHLELALELVRESKPETFSANQETDIQFQLGQLHWQNNRQPTAAGYFRSILDNCNERQRQTIATYTGTSFSINRLPTENPPTTNVVEEHQVFSSDGTILPTAPKISSENADDYSSAVSPDGKQIIFSSYRLKNAELFLLDIVSGQITQLTQTPQINEYMPVFSPNGQQIAFVTERKVSSQARLTVQLSGSTPSNATISIMDLNGQNRRRLTNNLAVERSPSFSPDGQTIIFEAVEQTTRTQDQEPDLEIFTISVDGQNKIQLTNNEVDDGFPSFSPDGQKIVFVSHRANNYDIFIMNQNGTELQQLTHTVSGDYQPSFSPDGLQIVYVSNRNNDYELFTMDSDGQNQRPLTNSVGVNLEPKFSPDGQKIYFTSDRDGYMRIFCLNLGQPVDRLTVKRRLNQSEYRLKRSSNR